MHYDLGLFEKTLLNWWSRFLRKTKYIYWPRESKNLASLANKTVSNKTVRIRPYLIVGKWLFEIRWLWIMRWTDITSSIFDKFLITNLPKIDIIILPNRCIGGFPYWQCSFCRTCFNIVNIFYEQENDSWTHCILAKDDLFYILSHRNPRTARFQNIVGPVPVWDSQISKFCWF